MAKTENKTQVTAVSPAAFIAAVPDAGRRADAQTLAKLMQAATGEPPKMWGPSIVGFGSHHYVYESGREGDTPVVSFSPRKAQTVLYGLRGFDGVEALLAKLGKHKTEGGCIYVKSLADVDLTVLETIIKKSAAARAKA
jgi:hypothetical protein